MIFAACAAFTLAVLVYVFWVPAELQATPDKTRLAYLEERKDAVCENLRDLNFEYKAGKPPDGAYHAMKSALEDEAVGLLCEIALLDGFAGASLEVPSQRKGARV